MEQVTLTPKQFNALPANMRRIKIAEDIIDTLARPVEQRYSPARLSYLVIRDASGDLTGDIQDALSEREPRGTCCALGALLISFVRIADGVDFEDICDTSDSDYYFHADGDKISDTLRPHFSIQMLGEIEGAFEGWQCGWDNAKPPVERLAKIARNIIRNNGDFLVGDLR